MSAVTAGPSPATGWPRRRLLLALLVVSVALNLFFVAGAAWTRWNSVAAIAEPGAALSADGGATRPRPAAADRL